MSSCNVLWHTNISRLNQISVDMERKRWTQRTTFSYAAFILVIVYKSFILPNFFWNYFVFCWLQFNLIIQNCVYQFVFSEGY
jgi:hypothetical protein